MNLNELIKTTISETVANTLQGDTVWEEFPVSPTVFFSDWLKPALSIPQLDVLDNLFKGKEWSKEYLEYLLFWGEGGGKDFTCARILIYTAYFLMCLRNPQKYLNFTESEPIDLVNISVNGAHSKNVFFNRFTTALKSVKNPATGKNWFEEKGMDLRDLKDIQVSKVNFKKNITAYSLNSVKYSGEGKNILLAIFDEIAEFKPHKAKEIYDNLWFTAITRWGSKEGSTFRIILISYLRHEHDYMNYRWEQSKTEKKIYRSKKTTWEVRPGKTKEDYKEAYDKNPEETTRRLENILMKGAGNSFFVYREKIKEGINKNRMSPFVGHPLKTEDLNDLVLFPHFKPFKTKEIYDLEIKTGLSEMEDKLLTDLKNQHSDALYFAHIDLAKGKQHGDAVGFGLGHLYKKNMQLEDAPYHVFIDIMMQLRSKEGEVDFERIRDFIFKLVDLGFPFGQISLDGYQSVDFQQCINKKGIKCEQLSVDRTDEAYQTLKERIYNKTIDYYDYPVFIRECEELIKVDNKVDHPEISLRRSIEEGTDRGSKDVSDTVAALTKSALDYVGNEVPSDWVGESF